VLFDRLIFFDDPLPRSGPANMAMDEVVLSLAAERGLPVLRVYRWDADWVSFGYFQEWEVIRAQLPAGVHAIRRWTGGGTVDHRVDETYSLMVPSQHELAQVPATESYRRVHGWLAQCLTIEGIPVELVAAPGLRAPAGWCFADPPVPGDLIANGGKVAGAAQRRTRAGLLHQGSVHLRSPDGAWPWERFAPLLATEVLPFHSEEEEEETAAQLIRAKYGTGEWLKRR